MAVVALDEVGLGFRGPLVLGAVQLAVEPGKGIGLLGRNGSGKTTLLHLRLGELAPQSGAGRHGTDLEVA